MPPNQQAREESCSTDLGNDPDHQEDIGVVFHNADKEEYAWNSRDPSGHLLVLPGPMNTVSGKPGQLHPSRTSNGSDPLAISLDHPTSWNKVLLKVKEYDMGSG